MPSAALMFDDELGHVFVRLPRKQRKGQLATYNKGCTERRWYAIYVVKKDGLINSYESDTLEKANAIAIGYERSWINSCFTRYSNMELGV